MNLIFQNAFATYARSVVALVLGLFSSRWVLQALGATDFGLYAVVGALVGFFSFLGGLLNASVARHYAFALGETGSEDDQRDWFAAAFRIHLLLAVLARVLGLPAGEWAVRRVLDIPPARVATCVQVFRLSLAAACANMLAVPFVAMYTARQKFVKLAVFGLGQTAVVFGGAWWLRQADCDRLLAYAGYMAFAFAGLAAVQIAGAMREFPSCRAVFARARPDRVRAILAFVGWTLCGGGGWIAAVNGGACVTNLFFGAAANAAYGVSQQVVYHSEQLANAMVGAFEPAVTASAGEGDRVKFLRLVRQSGLLGAGLFLLVAVPLFVLLDPVLKLWLGTPPEGAATVCRIVLAAMALNKLTTGQQLALLARGRIAAWQITVGVVLLLSVPLAVFLAWRGAGLAAAAWAYFAAYLCHAVANVVFARRVA